MDTQIITSLGTVIILTIGYLVMGVVKLRKQVSELETKNRFRDVQIENVERNIHDKIEGDTRSFDNSLVSLERKIEKEFEDVWRQMDSRLDKLENRITSKIPPTNDEVLKELEKVREDFLTLRKNL